MIKSASHLSPFVLLILGIGALASGCGDDGGATSDTLGADVADPGECGDGVCGGSESTESCAMDCQCNQSRECEFDEVCVANRCEEAWGRTYEIQMVSVELPPQNPATGTSWDEDGGAPDPFALFESNGVEFGRTPTAEDSFTATWTESYEITFKTPSDPGRIEVTAREDDGSASEFIGGFVGPAYGWLEIARGTRSGVLSGNGITIEVAVTPK